MKQLLVACLLALMPLGHVAQAEEYYYSPNMIWLRSTKPVMRFFIDMLEPLKEANGAAAMYLTGEIDRDEALLRLESARTSASMISENIEWSISLLEPPPEGGSADSRALVDQAARLQARLHDLDASSQQSILLLETFVKTNDIRTYKGGVSQMLSVMETLTEFIDPFYRIETLTLTSRDGDVLNMFNLARLDDQLSFHIDSLFYRVAVLEGGGIPPDELDQLVSQLETYVTSLDRMDADIASERKALEKGPLGPLGYSNFQLNELEAENRKRRRRLSAYHMVLAGLSAKPISVDLLDKAFEELRASYQRGRLPDFASVRSNAADSNADAGGSEEAAGGVHGENAAPSPRTSVGDVYAPGPDTPL